MYLPLSEWTVVHRADSYRKGGFFEEAHACVPINEAMTPHVYSPNSIEG
jgi:hypothetical protein